MIFAIDITGNYFNICNGIQTTKNTTRNKKWVKY
jgi:hypothetical protein